MITGPPSVAIDPVSLIIDEGENADVLCTGNGDPFPQVYWNMSGVVSDVQTTTSDDGRSQTLHIYNISVFDNGFISCIAENEARSETAVLTVHVKCKHTTHINLLLCNTVYFSLTLVKQ